MLMNEAQGELVISVVILNYNGAKWLERCLASIRQQTLFHQIEVIVADNASSDGSDQLAGQRAHYRERRKSRLLCGEQPRGGGGEGSILVLPQQRHLAGAGLSGKTAA
jgi:GT2 family glycosyltransferase